VLVEVWAEYQAAIYAFNLMKLRSKNSAGWLASAQDSDDRKNAPSQFCIGGSIRCLRNRGPLEPNANNPHVIADFH
jgi:hypothetical protein